MINNHDNLINHMEKSALCYAFEGDAPDRHVVYYFTDGEPVDQALVKNMVDQGFVAPKAGMFGDADGQELEYKGGLL